MRKTPVFLFVFILFFHGCNSTPESVRLAAIDSLIMADDRDSAYAEILRLDPHFSNAEDMAHYQLLLARTSFQTGHLLASDSTIDNAIAYYEETTDWEKLTDAYYYKAQGLNKRKEYAHAVKYYKKAEETAQKTDNIHQKYKIAESLVRINHVCGNYQLQLNYARKALGYALESGNKNYIAYSYFNLSWVFQFLGNVDSVCHYARELIPRLEDIYPRDIPHFLSSIGYMYFNENKLDSAKLYYEKSLSYLEHSNTLENLADVYMKEGNQEKAYELWQRAFLIDDENSKEVSMFNMLQCDLDNNRNLEDACERLYRIFAIKDSLSNTLKDRTILEMQQQYDEEVSRHQFQHKIMKWMVASLILVVILLFIVGFAKYKENQSRLTLAKNQMLINQYNHELILLRQQHQDTEQQKEILSRKISEMIENGSPMLNYGKKLYEDITQGKNTVRWKKNDYQCFVEYYKTLHFTEYEEMVRRYKHLTVQNIFYLILCEMGKNDDEIADIKGVNIESLRMTKKRLKDEKRKS